MLILFQIRKIFDNIEDNVIAKSPCNKHKEYIFDIQPVITIEIVSHLGFSPFYEGCTALNKEPREFIKHAWAQVKAISNGSIVHRGVVSLKLRSRNLLTSLA